jgi:alkanesulfonate monooxygenase SsuD/methylene tetrahydromethanopterin reductase-like flavin-dependent oxidoreductase (luciferase family)
VASLDQLSGGRFIFAIGGGWNVEEMENHGARYETRFKLLRERVLAMTALWTQEQAKFHGEFVNFDPVWQYPKPKQRPHPPILLGGETDHIVRRVVEFCDGWVPAPARRLGAQERGRAVAPSSHCRRTRSRDPFHHGLQCARRSGRARILPRCRHRTRAARSARSEPRRGAARARQECAADKWSVMADVASFTTAKSLIRRCL